MENTILKSKSSSLNDTVASIMRVLSKELNDSASYLDDQITNSYSQMIVEFITDPIASTANAIKIGQVKILDVISRLVKIFLISNKDIIELVYKANIENCLQYFIILREDKIQNRGKLNQFLMLYDRLPISDNNSQKLNTMFPVYFEYIKKEMLSEIESSKIEQVNLLDEPSLKSS